jgi:LysM repeat protein
MKTKQGLRALTIAALLVVMCVSVAAASPAGTPTPSVSPGYTNYTVQPGDNLYRISVRFGVSMYAIMQANGLANANYVYVGQVLRIPTGAVYPPPPPQPPSPPPTTGFYYTVRHGDTLALIAARFGTTVWAIMQANGIVNPNFVYVGQALWIPGRYIPPQPGRGSWYGEYFNNERLAGSPSVVRYDPAIDFDWGLGWPHPKISSTYFSVRWTRTLWLGTGTWRFTTTTDDGVRLWVDNRLAIDQWNEQPATAYTADVPLGAGYHAIRMEYFQLQGVASAHLSWQLISPGPCGYCPPVTPSPTGAWFGQYYDNMFLQGDPLFTRTDPVLDFNWPLGSPGGGIDRGLWSARWTQTVYFYAGKYRFHAIVDDGVRLFVDGGIVIDEWEDNPGTEFVADKWIGAGNHEIKVEFYQRGHEAKIKVWWEKLN